MEKATYFRLERLSAWSGYLLLVAFYVAFAFAGILSPISPTMGQQGIHDFLVHHHTGILVGTVIIVLAVPFEYPYVVVTSLQLRRIEGGWGLISMLQLLTGVVAPIGFFLPMAILSAAAFRPGEHSLDVLSAMSDIFWLMLVGNACIQVLQVWSIALGALIDKRPKPVFPRWYGWLNVVLGVLFIPGAFVFLTKTGPFAWNGLLAYLIPNLAYLVWKLSTPIVLLRAVKNEAAEEVAEQAAPVPS